MQVSIYSGHRAFRVQLGGVVSHAPLPGAPTLEEELGGGSLWLVLFLSYEFPKLCFKLLRYLCSSDVLVVHPVSGVV